MNLLGDPLPVRTELDYFRLFYPMQLNLATLEMTNDKLDPTGRKTRLTEHELLTYFGIRLNMTLDRKRLDVREYWEDEVRPGSTFTPPRLWKIWDDKTSIPSDIKMLEILRL